MPACQQILPLNKTVAPAEQAAVAEMVQSACREGTPVYPIGGGTSLDYGVRPRVPGVGLSLAKLNRVVDHAAEDMTITVEAGIPMATLAKRLSAERQRLPIDVRRAAEATIGGVVATNASGPRRYAWGTIRDYVIGVRVVDGQGTAFSAGGRVVKNAAGYNLCRLMVGSLGTLGVITQVTLMVRPRPQTSALVACEVPDFDAAEKLLAQLVHTETRPAAIELQAGSTRQDDPPIGPMLESSAARLFVGFEGSQAEVEWMVQRLCDAWRGAGLAPTVVVRAAEAGRLWDWLGDFPAQLQIDVLPSAMVRVIAHLLGSASDCSIRAHAGNGVIRVGLPPLESSELGTVLDNRFRPVVSESGGNMVVVSCPADAELTCRDIWGPSGDAAVVIRALKDRFDPRGLLNPGRFVDAD